MVEPTIHREIWEGKVPVCFGVAEEEVQENMRGDKVTPEPCYILVSRVTYFPLIYDRLEKLYRRAVQASKDDEIWLTSETKPLKWNYPVGVLYDLHGRGGGLPWNVTVHFKNFPEDELLHCPGKEAVESHFKSKIKEADNLKHRSEIIQSLTPAEFGILWEGLRQGNFVDFWSVNQKFMLNTRSEQEPFKAIPFCIYEDGKPVPFQRLVVPVKAGQEVTLGELLEQYKTHSGLSPDHCVLNHGVELPLHIPLQWLSEHFSYPDNFLHFCVAPRGSE